WLLRAGWRGPCGRNTRYCQSHHDCARERRTPVAWRCHRRHRWRSESRRCRRGRVCGPSHLLDWETGAHPGVGAAIHVENVLKAECRCKLAGKSTAGAVLADEDELLVGGELVLVRDD